MQELGRDGVARLFFLEFCKGHPELLKPAEDNINLIKKYTLGYGRWTRMTEYRKTFTRDKFTHILPFIKFVQEKCGDTNDTYGVVKKLNRQESLKKKKSMKSLMSDEVQSFDEGEDSESARTTSRTARTPASASTKSASKKSSEKEKTSTKPSSSKKGNKGGVEVLPIDDFD